MRVIQTTVEPAGPGIIRLTTLLEVDGSADEPSREFGEGPTGDAVPDRIVRYLMDHPDHEASIADIQTALGGNPGTVNRQAWTLANDAPDLQRRLRGWVQSLDRGRYGLTPDAVNRVAGH